MNYKFDFNFCLPCILIHTKINANAVSVKCREREGGNNCGETTHEIRATSTKRSSAKLTFCHLYKKKLLKESPKNIQFQQTKVFSYNLFIYLLYIMYSFIFLCRRLQVRHNFAGDGGGNVPVVVVVAVEVVVFQPGVAIVGRPPLLVVLGPNSIEKVLA